MNRRIALRTITLSVLARPLTVFAQQIDGPQSRFEDDLISNLEGGWLLTRQIRATQVQNRVTANWVLNHQFLEVRMKDVKEPPSYEAIVLVGYIHATKQYVAHWTDTLGGKFSAMGLGTRGTNSVEFRFEYPDGSFFNTFS